MNELFSAKTQTAISYIWMQYQPDKITQGKQLLEEAVQEGDVEAYCFLARTYLPGTLLWQSAGLYEDKNIAADLLLEGAEKGSACCILTMLQYEALAQEVEQRISEEGQKNAYNTVYQHAQGGHAFCQMLIGMCYYWGGYSRIFKDNDLSDDDFEQFAAEWFEKAVLGGVTIAMINLHSIYEESSLPDYDEGKIMELLEYSAEKGDPMWQDIYADMLFNEERYEESVYWYEKAAASGNAGSYFDAALMYELGENVEKNHSKAAELYGKGAKLGHADCMAGLGKQYLHGWGLPKDETKAFYWFQQAAELNSELGKMYLGHCLMYGIGTRKEEEKGNDMIWDALRYNFPGDEEEQDMIEGSAFDFDVDIMQIYLDIADSSEKGIGCSKNTHVAGFYFNLLAYWGVEEGIERIAHYKKNWRGKWKKAD